MRTEAFVAEQHVTETPVSAISARQKAYFRAVKDLNYALNVKDPAHQTRLLSTPVSWLDESGVLQTEDFLTLSLEYKKLTTFKKLLNIGHSENVPLTEQQWRAINRVLEDEEAKFEGMGIKSLYHRTITKFIDLRLNKDRAKAKVKKYKILAPILAIPVVLSFFIPQQILQMIGKIGLNLYYGALSIKHAIANRLKAKAPKISAAPVLLSPYEAYKHSTKKPLSQYSREANIRYNVTLFSYAALQLTIFLFAKKALPILIKAGKTALGSLITGVASAIAGILLAGAELWIARKYHKKIKEIKSSYAKDLNYIEGLIQSKTQDKALAQSNPKTYYQAILDLKLQRAEIVATYDAKLNVNHRKRKAGFISAGIFAVVGLSFVIPPLAPYIMFIAAAGVIAWAGLKIRNFIKNRKTYTNANETLANERARIKYEHGLEIGAKQLQQQSQVPPSGPTNDRTLERIQASPQAAALQRPAVEDRPGFVWTPSLYARRHTPAQTPSPSAHPNAMPLPRYQSRSRL